MCYARKRVWDAKFLKASREQLEEDEECVLHVETISRPIEVASLLSPTHSSIRKEREKATLGKQTDSFFLWRGWFERSCTRLMGVFKLDISLLSHST